MPDPERDGSVSGQDVSLSGRGVPVSARLALSLRAAGPAGQEWLTGLPALLDSLAADWSITIGARLDGGRAAYVAEAATRDGKPAVLKVTIPPGDDRQLVALQLGGGDPYVGLLRHDVARRALLLERLGPPLAALGRPASRQLELLARTAARGWRPVEDHGRLPTWIEAARWHAAFIPSMWETLGRPCSEAAVELAVRCAALRGAAFEPGRAVLVHGDVHALNTLRKSGTDFRLVDPSGLVSEPAHDLGVILARGVQEWRDGLAAGDPRQAWQAMTDSCRELGRIAGADPEAVRQWACTEIVSTGLHVLSLGDHNEARAFLTVADKLAAATEPERASASRSGSVALPVPARHEAPTPPRLFLMVGLPGAGKTTRAKELAATRRALRLTPDEWMISLFDGVQPDGKRFLVEGRLITVALQALRLGTNVVLDFGLWSRDERSALHWLAQQAGASCEVVYLPVDRETQLARVAHRQDTAPHTTFPIVEADLDLWRTLFEVPDAAELRGELPEPPPGWAQARWPSLDVT
ncbi:AAA family ATPase [Paractinoplanes lichenicola]|uniref:AAA family ATPase n=1 Tax=Paractinoplanes lichenicola TaxID=2802976 RepID=A0ABS1VLX5_9ACTN|nr:AAA family ATPase [Actinoplanes lichenicola]MBL7255730.1 AAA family ATPase [Actinoplanes lichenicola]